MAGSGGNSGGNTQPIQNIEDMSGMGVFRLLDKARAYGKNLSQKPAPKSGYLDTQLFPGKKKPKVED